MDAATHKPEPFGPYSRETARKSGSPAVAHPASGWQADPIWIANPLEIENPDPPRWGFSVNHNRVIVFSFGAYASTMVAVVSQSLDDALETAAGWLADHAPGVFVEPDYLDAYRDISGNSDATEIPDDLDDETAEEIREAAETDLTYTESGWIASWEWTMTELDSTDPLAQKIVRKCMDAYRKQYGENPR